MPRVESPPMPVSTDHTCKVLYLHMINGVPPEDTNVVLERQLSRSSTGLKVVDDAIVWRQILGEILDGRSFALGLGLSNAVNLGHVACSGWVLGYCVVVSYY